MAVKSLRMHIFWWNFAKLLIFMIFFTKESILKIENFGSPTKNSDFSDFLGILLLFSTNISRLRTNIYNSNYQSSFRTC